MTRLQASLTEASSESSIHREKLSSLETTLDKQTRSHAEERDQFMKRVDDLSQQNSLLHIESEKLSAKLLTLQEQGRGEDTSSLPTAAVIEDAPTEQLWEIIRFVHSLPPICSFV